MIRMAPGIDQGRRNVEFAYLRIYALTSGSGTRENLKEAS